MSTSRSIIYAALALAVTPAVADASTPLEFTNIVGSGSGAEGYARVPSARYQVWLDRFQDSLTTPLTPLDFGAMPAQSRGLPGVVIFDYDGDGDQDVFVTNGPGGDNALLDNQINQSGTLTFVDRAAFAGVEATAMDASGACQGDIDNDGDADLFVVGFEESHRLYANNGDGTFTEITAGAGLADDHLGASSCAMGDVDQDGFLDVIVSHSWDQNFLFECFSPGFSLMQPNELYVNLGDNTFMDESALSGILDLGGLPAGAQGASWSTALVDYDLDGDVDLFTTDDQCAFNPGSEPGGADRGYMQVWDNDGDGGFTSATVAAGLDRPGAWMGVSFADYNRDGFMDLFGTNMGDWFPRQFGNTAPLPYATSRWFLGGPGGVFTDPGVGDLFTTPFAWGSSSEDLDNDGDHDIVSLGAIHLITNKEASNPGTIFVNDGSGEFTVTNDAWGANHQDRADHGVAAGDLNLDGRVDIVTVSSHKTKPTIPFLPYSLIGILTGSPFDATAGFQPILFGDPVNGFVWAGELFDNGDISIEINETATPFGSVSVDTVGTVGITSDGVVNRSGFGAVVKFKPRHQPEAMKPVAGGSSHLSQDSEILTFGTAGERKGRLEVLWPDGVRNRLYRVREGQHVVFPEIPCSFDDDTISNHQYVRCVADSIDEIVDAGIVSHLQGIRFFVSALIARYD